MKMRVLIVEDVAENARDVEAVLDAHGFTHDTAADMESAEKLFAANDYCLAILDMDFPVSAGRLSRPENGKLLIGKIRKGQKNATLPIIVLTGRDGGKSDFIVSVMKCGHGGWIDYIQKPLVGDRIDHAIREALENSKAVYSEAPKAGKSLEPFSAKKRTLQIHEDHITLCGATVWRSNGMTEHIRDAMALLSVLEEGRYVRISGAQLSKKLGRGSTNHIGSPLSVFAERIAEVMASVGIACGKDDVFTNDHGLHFREWIEVKIVGNWAEALGITANVVVTETTATNEKDTLNERQKWVVDQVAGGAQLSSKDVVAHFRGRWNRSTINRDLKELRERGIIKVSGHGQYARSNGRGVESA